jgi:hypothetical protein
MEIKTFDQIDAASPSLREAWKSPQDRTPEMAQGMGEPFAPVV